MTLADHPTNSILPGQTIGIYGGGQLGRMLALVARRAGYRVHVFTNEPESPAGHFANAVFLGEDTDERQFRRFANSIDVLTFEFENVSAESLAWVPDQIPVRPGPKIFWTTQDRQREKNFLEQAGIPLPKFSFVNSQQDLQRALQDVGLPAVLKTASGGYDGKGQVLLRTSADAVDGWRALREEPCTLEEFVDLACEVSVIVAADVFGQVGVYGPIENRHSNHILDVSLCPAQISDSIAQQARQLACRIAQEFQLVGLLCVEFFVTSEGRVLANEIAPRPHNSGHLTIEAFATSQFEQQLRCVCGLPLGSTTQLRPVAMANLLGDIWFPEAPDWGPVFQTPTTYLHLYDKSQARVGRKMGHITSCGESVGEALDAVVKARNLAARRLKSN